MLSRSRKHLDLLQEEDKGNCADEADHPGNREVEAKARLDVTLGRGGSIEDLDDRQISRLNQSRVLELLSQKRDERFLHLQIPRQSRQLNTQLGDLWKRHCKVAPVGAGCRCGGYSVPVLHLREVTPHLIDSAPKCHHFRVGLRRKASHDLELHFGSQDVSLEPRSDLDGSSSLLLERDGLVALLKASETLFRCPEIRLC